MKRLNYILFAALLLAVACNRDNFVPIDAVPDPLPEGTMAKVTFTVTFPDNVLETKAGGEMGDQPDITSMYVAVLGSGEGKVNYWLPATFEELAGDGYNNKAQYSVMLPLSSERTPIHFVANPPEGYMPVFGESEKSQMDRLITSGTAGAYWQKVILDKVPAKVSGGEYVTDDDGNYLVDVEKAFKLGTQTPGLVDVPLVRNFCKINYTVADDADFTLLAWTLVNVPSSGYITPYQDGYDTPYVMIGDFTLKGTEGEEGYQARGDFYQALEDGNYYGYQTANSIVTTKPTEPTSCPEAIYMYERRIPDADNAQTAVIAHIQWKSASEISAENVSMAGKDFWYKIELLDEDNEYIPFRRNIYYNFVLMDIEGDGEQSFDDAYSGPYFGDISSSIETANLNEVNNNQSRIVVNQMDFVHVGSNSKTFDVFFQFYPNAASQTPVITTVNNSATSGNYVNTSVRAVPNYDPAFNVAQVQPQDATGGWGHITVTVNGSSGSTLRTKLRVQGNATGKRVIYRDITFTVMEKQDLTSETDLDTPQGTNGKNKPVTVTIGLPEDLGYSMFPLQFQIEPKNNNLSTNDSKLPVQFGPSAYTSGKNAYYFLKTITYAEYCRIENGQYVYTTEFPCSFFTTQDGNNDVTLTITNVDSQGYFNSVELPE